MPRLFFYNNVGPVNTNTEHSNGLESEGRSIMTKSRDGRIISGTTEERSIHINAELLEKQYQVLL